MPGKVIRKYRELRNFTQENVAQQMGISQNAYSKIENNQTQLTISHLKLICKILDVPVSELLRDEFEIHTPYSVQESIQKEHLIGALKDLRHKIEIRIPERHGYYSILHSLLTTVNATVNSIH
jgi:transcriptional regulator with XRE-family HTH domain